MAGSATTREIHSNYFENAFSHAYSTRGAGLPPWVQLFGFWGLRSWIRLIEPSVRSIAQNDPAGPATALLDAGPTACWSFRPR